MLLKTHLAITVLAILLLLSLIEHKVIFIIVALIATLLPDIDSSSSSVGGKIVLRPLQVFVKHRGIFHSFLLLFLITFILVLFYPTIALGFFLGYSLHIFADSFTQNGVRFFYTFKKNISGTIRTGGKTDTTVFVFFLLADLFMIAIRIKGLF